MKFNESVNVTFTYQCAHIQNNIEVRSSETGNEKWMKSTNIEKMAVITRVREKQKHSSMEQFNHKDRVYTVFG